MGAGAGEVNAAAGSNDGLRDWTKRRKEEEKVPVAAASAGAAAMRDVRPCGSERAADGRGAGGAAALDAEETGFGFGLDLGFDFDFAAAVGLGLGRGLGGGGSGAERPRGGETETSERRDPSESESSACVGEYIGGGGARSRVWWVDDTGSSEGLGGNLRGLPAKALARRNCGGSGCRKDLWKYHESPGPVHRAARHVIKI
jgi:hypothetical protein